MRELPQNPNTRKPYSDVNIELTVLVGDVCGYIGRKLDDYERHNLEIKLVGLEQAMLRTRAVLDPATLTDAEWVQAELTTWAVIIPLEEKPYTPPPPPPKPEPPLRSLKDAMVCGAACAGIIMLVMLLVYACLLVL